jgi:three-Cys-motif partner protein
MARTTALKFDTIGNWSEVKLDIISDYAKEYSTIFHAEGQRNRFEHIYVDGFAGAGVYIRKQTGGWIAGSPLAAVNTDPPFRSYHFIDLDGQKVDYLKGLVGERHGVHIYQGDCNRILLDTVLPQVRYENFRRGLCVLDPYGLHLNWDVIRTAGQMKSIEIFLNFPIMDMNRNVIWSNPARVSTEDIARMNAFWGDESWRDAAYRRVSTLFDIVDEKTDNETVVAAFRQRLKEVAGFKYVPEPVPMCNSTGATVYYLFFASPKPVAENIVRHIFNKYRHQGAGRELVCR